MKEKINYEGLFVACPVYDHEVEEESWIQYESFGRVNHHIIVSPKRVLIYSKVDEDGVLRYYDYSTGEEVVERCYETSYMSTSSPGTSLYCGYINGYINMPIRSLRGEILARHAAKKKSVGYFMPLDEYLERKLSVAVPVDSLFMADKLVRVLNVSAGRSFELSHDKEKADKQLEKIGYRSKSKKK